MKLKTQKAFSLVELMVTISIIAVMAAVGLVTFSTVQKTGRDAQRKSDLNIIKAALQQFYADKNYYPNTLVLTGGAVLTNVTGDISPPAPTKTYLSKTPIDPSWGSGNPYCYISYQSVSDLDSCSVAGNAGTCHYYILFTRLENSSTGTYTCNSINTYNSIVTPL